MKSELLKHKRAYLSLFIGLIILGLLFFAAWPRRDWQRIIALMLMTFYFLWGVVAHVKTETITKQVVMEYLAVSVLATLPLLLITL